MLTYIVTQHSLYGNDSQYNTWSKSFQHHYVLCSPWVLLGILQHVGRDMEVIITLILGTGNKT